MTAIVERPTELWSTMPGWGIVANLTPPELIAARKLSVIRKLLVAAVTVIVVLGALGFAFATLRQHSASSDLAKENARTQQLMLEQRKYQGAVKVQGSITEVRTQLAGLLSSDVDLGSLVGQLRTRLPAGMTIDTLTVTINTGTIAMTSNTGAGALDTSGSKHIGDVSIGGSGQRLSDVSGYVDALNSIPGVVTAYPASSSSSSAGVAYIVQLTLTSKLFTHRYDSNKSGVK